MRALFYLILLCRLLPAAPTLADYARELARRVASAASPADALSLTVANLSQLSSIQTAEVQRALESELRTRGLAITPGAPAAVTVRLSENYEGVVWAAEIRRADKVQNLLLARPFPAAAAETSDEFPVSLERKLLWEQNEPILDLFTSETRQLVLEPARLCFYQHAGNRWEKNKCLDFPAGWVAPRDPRGRLEVRGDAFQARLPGLACSGRLEPPEMDCQPAATEFVPAGNRLKNEPARPAEAEWGSDFTPVKDPCGPGTLILASSAALPSEPDSVQVFGPPAPVSPALDFFGPVTALWPEPEGGSTLVVSRSLKSDRYAAYRLTLVCAR